MEFKSDLCWWYFVLGKEWKRSGRHVSRYTVGIPWISNEVAVIHSHVLAVLRMLYSREVNNKSWSISCHLVHQRPRSLTEAVEALIKINRTIKLY